MKAKFERGDCVTVDSDRTAAIKYIVIGTDQHNGTMVAMLHQLGTGFRRTVPVDELKLAMAGAMSR